MRTEKLTFANGSTLTATGDIDHALQVAEKNTILRCIVGSAAFGLETEESGSDRDEMGVVVETPTQALGMVGFEQLIRRTAEQRDGQGARSKAGDLDLVLYGLRKFLRLGEAMMRGFSRDVLAQGADFEQLARVDPPRSEQLRIGPWLEESAPVPESVFAPAVKACVVEATEAAFREVATPLEDMPVPAPCATYPDTTNMAPDPEPCRAVEPVSFSTPDPPTSYDPPSGGGGDL